MICDLDHMDMTLCQSHDPSLDHGQELCEILSRSNEQVKKLWSKQDANRRTNTQGDFPIYPKLLLIFSVTIFLFQCVWINDLKNL